MKNLLENFAILLVGLLSLTIILLIVQYNMIEEDNTIEEIAYEIPQKKQESKKVKVNNYLQNLEGYGDDVNVKVDPTKEDRTNEVVVKSELGNNKLVEVVDDKAKNAYMENLEAYSKKAKEEKLDEIKPVDDSLDDPEKLDKQEIDDEIGMAIDAALEDL